MDRLDLNPEIVCLIAERAREFQGQETVELPGAPESMEDDMAVQVLASHSDDLTYRELKSTIEDLEPDQQVSLVALMWLGRGDFTLEDWDDLLAEAQSAWNRRTAEYLLATPLLSDYLGEGLAIHGFSCSE